MVKSRCSTLSLNVHISNILCKFGTQAYLAKDVHKLESVQKICIQNVSEEMEVQL